MRNRELTEERDTTISCMGLGLQSWIAKQGDSMRHKGFGPYIPNSVAQLISYHRPESAVFYRMRDQAGATHPPQSERPYRCVPSLDVPYVPAGPYEIAYFDREGNEIEVAGGSPPEILVDAQYGALKTPGDLEEEEDKRLQRIERRELRNQREASLTHSLEKSADVVQKLSQTVAETNERHSRAIAELSDKYNAQVIEREGAVLHLVKGVLEVVQQQTRGASEAGAQQIKRIDHWVDKTRASQDWPGVVREVVVQLGTLAQAFAPRESPIRDGKPRLPSTSETAPKLPAGPLRELPARSDAPARSANDAATRTASAARSAAESQTPMSTPAAPRSESAAPRSESATVPSESVLDDSQTSWIDRIFGWSEPPPKPSEPVAQATPAPVPESAPAVPQEAAKPAEDTPSTSAQTQESEPETAPETALVPIDLGAVLAQLLAHGNPNPEPPRPAEWSRSWALKEAKRRVLALGEAGFLWTVTQPRRLLSFVTDLVAAIRPPPVGEDLDGLRPAEVLP